MGHPFTKKSFVVYLKPKSNWLFWMLTGNPTPNIWLDTVRFREPIVALCLLCKTPAEQWQGQKISHPQGLLQKGKKKMGLQAMLTLNLQLCHQQIKINWNQFSWDKVSLPGWSSSAVLTAPSNETGACKLISLLKHTLKWISQNSLAGSHPGPTSWSASVNIEIW